jgi:branched-chain amino acid transport system ATP-binding protein
VRLELRDVTAGYGGVLAIRDVDLVVPDSTVVALLGANGAGKTTLLSVASGLLPVTTGQILLDGVDVTGEPSDSRARRGLCHVTEGRSVFPGLTVAENLRMFAPPGGSEDRLALALEAFPRLGQRAKQVAGTMSGGEQQMLAMARAYVRRAPVVLLDEVSMGLAPIVVDEIFDFVRKLAQEGTSLLIVEQYVNKALDLADVVYLLARGRVVFCGEPGELRDSDIFARYLGSETGSVTAST